MNKHTFLRVWHSLRLLMITSSGQRAEYIRRHRIFHYLGDRCTIVERKVPLYPRLISIGSNVHLASKVLLVTHDAIHLCLNNYEKNMGGDSVFKENLGCIIIGDNVFVGSNTTILPNVRIGSNVIIGAGSLVNRDIPSNSVAAGVPAKVVGSFENFVEKRRRLELYPTEFTTSGHVLSDDLEKWLWEKMK